MRGTGGCKGQKLQPPEPNSPTEIGVSVVWRPPFL